MKVDIENLGNVTIISFSNKNITTIKQLRFIIYAVCCNYCFEPNSIFSDEWGFETWFNSINPKGVHKKYKVICGYNENGCICEWH